MTTWKGYQLHVDPWSTCKTSWGNIIVVDGVFLVTPFFLQSCLVYIGTYHNYIIIIIIILTIKIKNLPREGCHALSKEGIV